VRRGRARPRHGGRAQRRTGNSPAPDGTWTPFTVVTGPIDVSAGYLQYRLQLSSTAAAQTPLVNNVTIDLKR
jgi:hypothetical protein